MLKYITKFAWPEENLFLQVSSTVLLLKQYQTFTEASVFQDILLTHFLLSIRRTPGNKFKIHDGFVTY